MGIVSEVKITVELGVSESVIIDYLFAHHLAARVAFASPSIFDNVNGQMKEKATSYTLTFYTPTILVGRVVAEARKLSGDRFVSAVVSDVSLDRDSEAYVFAETTCKLPEFAPSDDSWDDVL